MFLAFRYDSRFCNHVLSSTQSCVPNATRKQLFCSSAKCQYFAKKLRLQLTLETVETQFWVTNAVSRQ